MPLKSQFIRRFSRIHGSRIVVRVKFIVNLRELPSHLDSLSLHCLAHSASVNQAESLWTKSLVTDTGGSVALLELPLGSSYEIRTTNRTRPKALQTTGQTRRSDNAGRTVRARCYAGYAVTNWASAKRCLVNNVTRFLHRAREKGLTPIVTERALCIPIYRHLSLSSGNFVTKFRKC